jgi:AcrR family transcriptional regulator
MTISDTGARTSSSPRPGRPRDAAASRLALLDAARELFGKKGFERTTIREIGDAAGVDAALIARYFGSKADLYIAAVVAESRDDQRPREYEHLEQMVEALVTRTDEQGPGPIVQALIRSDTSEEIRVAARAHLVRRLIEPLVAGMADDGADHPRLRAEITVSALIGVSLGRSLGWFEELRTVPASELVDLITRALGPLDDPAQDDRTAPPAP